MPERISHANPVDAVLLGGKDSDAIGFNGQYKFALKVEGREDILAGVLDAIDRTRNIDRVFFVGPQDLISDRVKGRKKDYITVPDTGSLWGNLSESIEEQQKLRGGNEVLVVCSDLPFLTAESMDWLVTNSRGKDSLQIPVVSKGIAQGLSPTYETYYWPMREFPFKWSNNMLLDVNKIADSGMQKLFNRYRETGGDNYSLSALRRMQLLNEYGGPEAICALLLNYASKLLQLKFEGRVPFSRLIGKSDYERILTRILGTNSELLQTPFVDAALDVDNHLRLGIFQRGSQEIRRIVEKQAKEVHL